MDVPTPRGLVCAAIMLLGGTAMAQRNADALRSDLDPAFRPELVGLELLQEAVRPRDQAWMTFRFRNAGTAAARDNYRVFVHLEYPEQSCGNIRFQYDHMPTVATSRWEPGREIADGPHPIPVPADAARAGHHLHLGVFAAESGGGRLLDVYWDAPVVVSDEAEPAEISQPDPLPEAELPRCGFVVVSPTFCAFHATAFGGKTYATPALFTARALDGKPLWESDKVRVFHGFGEPELRLAGKAFRVEREEVVAVGR